MFIITTENYDHGGGITGIFSTREAAMAHIVLELMTDEVDLLVTNRGKAGLTMDTIAALRMESVTAFYASGGMTCVMVHIA